MLALGLSILLCQQEQDLNLLQVITEKNDFEFIVILIFSISKIYFAVRLYKAGTVSALFKCQPKEGVSTGVF